MYPPHVAKSRPNTLACVVAETGDSLTYAQLDAYSNQFAHLLRQNGVRPGDALAIIAENGLGWPIVVAAGMRSGVEVTPINWHLKPAELASILEECSPAAIVTSAKLRDVVSDALATSGVTSRLVVEMDDLAETCRTLPTTPIEDELLGARVLYSGGSTGRPKAYRQPLLGIHPADAPPRHSHLAQALGLDQDTVFLSPAPNYHAAPFTFQLMVLGLGGTIVTLESFDGATAMRAISAHGVTHSQWVPTMLTRLLRIPDRDKLPPRPTHRVAVTSGAPCPPELKDAITAWWGPMLHEYYGASEGYGHTYISATDALTHRGSVGRGLGPTRVRVVDDQGAPVPAGEIGLVEFGQAGADAQGLPAPPKRWRGMGDLGRLDEDGFLHLTGRSSSMIISGGVNIYPEEVEAALANHPSVADCTVFGIPDPDFGEQVKAVVELDPRAPRVSADELIAFCREQLASFKAPRSVDLVDRLPRLPTGKLNKTALRSTYLPAKQPLG
ncbi:AMP-binding protein [Streptomyces sp. NPDC127091]|uniref:AMP-binding protein n=1 Tax=Streptomyces sp. NPDC127091 TaxID=3347134 RepID=UPI00365DEB32